MSIALEVLQEQACGGQINSLAPVSGTPDQKKNTGTEVTHSDAFLVAFAEPFDCENPKDWSIIRKWLVTSVLSASGFNRIMVSTIMAPALAPIANDLDMNSVESVMAMSVFLLATAFGPLFIGPLSEIYGRKPVVHITNVWFLCWNIICGFANSKGLLIAARSLAGLGASAIYVLGTGVLGDVWRPEQRGTSLGLYLLVPLLGASVGPIIGGYITAHISWRWIFWTTSCVQAILTLASMLLFEETHAPTILDKKAKLLRHSANEARYYTATKRMHGQSPFATLRRSLSRPIRLLVFHPIVQIQATLSAFEYGITYFVLSSFSDLWISRYGESISKSGLHYISFCIGEVIGSQVTGPLMDVTFRRLKAKANGAIRPEFHVPLMVPGVIFVPIGLLLYGWAAQKHAFWLVVDIGVLIIAFGSQVSGQALQAYVIDSYPDHTSSASAASQFLRSLTAFGFPLFAPKNVFDAGLWVGKLTVSFRRHWQHYSCSGADLDLRSASSSESEIELLISTRL